MRCPVVILRCELRYLLWIACAQIIKLGALKGMDEPATRMRAEAYIENRMQVFVKFDDMSLAQLSEVKLAINKLKTV